MTVNGSRVACPHREVEGNPPLQPGHRALVESSSSLQPGHLGTLPPPSKYSRL